MRPKRERSRASRATSLIAVRKTVRKATPALPYERIARYILGPHYDLSLVICGDTLARRMYRRYRMPSLTPMPIVKKTYASNVLSFPYSKHEGEIFLNTAKAAREAHKGGISQRERLALLFVHGCYHLKGLGHGQRMESLERKTMRHFGFAAN